MSGEDDGRGSGAAKPAETTLTTTAASSVAQTSEIQNTNAVTSGANVTAPQKTEKAKPMTTMMMSSKNPPKQSEEDMNLVAQTARKQKDEWVRTNKDRESMHRSRTRSVEAYEKLEQVSVLDPIFALLLCILLVFSSFEFVFADNKFSSILILLYYS